MWLPFTLRASQSLDADLFYTVTELTMRPHVIAAGGSWEEESRRDETDQDAISSNASVIMVGADNAGILVVERLPYEVRLETLYLLPGFQGLGIGSALVSGLQREVAARCVPLRLHVLKVNPAKRFYESLGFVASHEGLKLHLKTR